MQHLTDGTRNIIIDNFKDLQIQKDNALYNANRCVDESIKARGAYKIAYEQARMRDEVIPYLNNTTIKSKKKCNKRKMLKNHIIILIIFGLLIMLACRNKDLLQNKL